MKKLVNLGKNSFSLLETIISIFLLSIVIIGFLRFSYFDNFEEEFTNLNNIENSFVTKNYNSDFNTSNVSIKIIRNGSNIEIVNVNKTTYDNGKIKIFKYEL